MESAGELYLCRTGSARGGTRDHKGAFPGIYSSNSQILEQGKEGGYCNWPWLKGVCLAGISQHLRGSSVRARTCCVRLWTLNGGVAEVLPQRADLFCRSSGVFL